MLAVGESANLHHLVHVGSQKITEEAKKWLRNEEPVATFQRFRSSRKGIWQSASSMSLISTSSHKGISDGRKEAVA